MQEHSETRGSLLEPYKGPVPGLGKGRGGRGWSRLGDSHKTMTMEVLDFLGKTERLLEVS